MAYTLFQTKKWKSINNFSFTSHPILPLVSGRTSKHTTFLFYLTLNVSLKNFFFFLMPGFFFYWMPANFHFSTSQPADVLYALILFLYTHIHICMYVYNPSHLGFSLAITVFLCSKKNPKTRQIREHWNTWQHSQRDKKGRSRLSWGKFARSLLISPSKLGMKTKRPEAVTVHVVTRGDLC